MNYNIMKPGKLAASFLLLAFISTASYAQFRTFHNLPYAHAERFSSPVMADGWDRDADYTGRGPQCPQTETGNNMFLAGRLPQSEDCLVLSVNTPAMEGKRPVVVFIHGGSHHHGSGEWEVYDCSALAREQDVVTVSMSFRHGVFGYLYDASRGNSNLGYEDQVAALRWIRNNIADFGGDPDNITVTGQSAGAQSLVFLITTLQEKLFRRAVVFSAPFLLNQKSSKAEKNAEEYLKILGKDPKEATIDEMVAAEKTFKKEVGGGAMPFSPSGLAEYENNIRSGVEDVVVCWQQHDGAMWAMGARKKELPEFGDRADMALTKVITDLVFKNGAGKFTRCLKRQGINAVEYEFTWCPPGANWKAAHGVEIAFLYGFREQILGYGLVGDTTPELYEEVCTGFRKTVADFARTGTWECSLGRKIR